MASNKQLFGYVIVGLAFTLVFFIGIIMFSGIGSNQSPNGKSETLLANAISSNSVAPVSPPVIFSMATAYKSGKFTLGNSLAVGSNTLYYLYFPASTAKDNPNSLAIIAGSNFISEVVGLEAGGAALEFSQKACKDSAESDFAPSGFFAHAGAVEVSNGKTICVRAKGTQSRSDIKITGLSADSVQFTQ